MARVFLIIGLLLWPSLASAQNTLKVIIGDVGYDLGTLRLFVHSEQSYPIEEEAVLYMKLKPVEGDMIQWITGLEPGRYAIIVHHDENDDDEFETNQFGMGSEGVGYTQDPRLDFGMPEFQDVWFDIREKNETTVVYMTY